MSCGIYTLKLAGNECKGEVRMISWARSLIAPMYFLSLWEDEYGFLAEHGSITAASVLEGMYLDTTRCMNLLISGRLIEQPEFV